MKNFVKLTEATQSHKKTILLGNHTFLEFGLEMEYPESWEIQDIVGGENIIRSGSEKPVPILSFESKEKTSNLLPDFGIDMPKKFKETFFKSTRSILYNLFCKSYQLFKKHY